jgi:diaminopimelate epimerase
LIFVFCLSWPEYLLRFFLSQKLNKDFPKTNAFSPFPAPFYAAVTCVSLPQIPEHAVAEAQAGMQQACAMGMAACGLSAYRTANNRCRQLRSDTLA